MSENLALDQLMNQMGIDPINHNPDTESATLQASPTPKLDLLRAQLEETSMNMSDSPLVGILMSFLPMISDDKVVDDIIIELRRIVDVYDGLFNQAADPA